MIKFIVIMVVVLVVIIANMDSIINWFMRHFMFQVPPGYKYVRLRLGKVYSKSVLTEGYHLKIPGYSVDRRVNMKIQDINLEADEFWLVDKVEGMLKWFIRFQVTDPLKFSYVHDDPIAAINNSSIEKAKESLSKTSSDQATTALDIVNDKFEQALPELNKMADLMGMRILVISAKKIDFKPEYEASLERIRAAENEAKEIVTRANAFASAKMAKFNPYIELAKMMQEHNIASEYYKAIIDAMNVSDAVEAGVDTMILPSGPASLLTAAKKIMEQ